MGLTRPTSEDDTSEVVIRTGQAAEASARMPFFVLLFFVVLPVAVPIWGMRGELPRLQEMRRGGANERLLSFLIAVLLLRRVFALVAIELAVWWIAGNDSWFESPYPDRATVRLLDIGFLAAFLACTGVLWIGSSRLPEDQRAHLRAEPFWGKSD